MTVIDRLRSAIPGGDASPGGAGDGPGPGWRRGVLVGVLTAVLSVALVVVPTYLAWSAAEPVAGSAGDAVAVGAGLWLLTAGARVTAGPGTTIALTPLIGLLALVLLARLGAREAMVRVSVDGPLWWDLLPRRLAATLGAWFAGYTTVVLGTAWAASSGLLSPVWPSVALPAVALPLLGIALALRRVIADDPDLLGPRAGLFRLPDPVRRGVGPGLAGLLVLLGVGAAVVVGALAVSWDGVRAVHEGLAAGGTGSLLLAAVQAGMLPNLALWVTSFLAGPGFQVVDGAVVSWSGAHSGLLPMVPVLAALPQPGPFPVVVPLLAALVLVAVGAYVGRRSLGTVARLARLRTKLAAATAGCATTALAAGLLDAVGGGSLGQFRLTSVGAPALTLTVSLFGWLLLGAVLAVLRDAWRLRR